MNLNVYCTFSSNLGSLYSVTQWRILHRGGLSSFFFLCDAGNKSILYSCLSTIESTRSGFDCFAFRFLFFRLFFLVVQLESCIGARYGLISVMRSSRMLSRNFVASFSRLHYWWSWCVPPPAPHRHRRSWTAEFPESEETSGAWFLRWVRNVESRRDQMRFQKQKRHRQRHWWPRAPNIFRSTDIDNSANNWLITTCLYRPIQGVAIHRRQTRLTAAISALHKSLLTVPRPVDIPPPVAT